MRFNQKLITSSFNQLNSSVVSKSFLLISMLKRFGIISFLDKVLMSLKQVLDLIVGEVKKHLIKKSFLYYIRFLPEKSSNTSFPN
jgi:hypothetical protein